MDYLAGNVQLVIAIFDHHFVDLAVNYKELDLVDH